MSGEVMMKEDEAKILRDSGLFDTEWYLKTYPDVRTLGMDPIEHYLWLGARLKRSPSPGFDTGRYLAENPDVAAAGVNALVHYLKHGKEEGRSSPLGGGDHSGIHSSTFHDKRPYSFASQAFLDQRGCQYQETAAAQVKRKVAVFSAVTDNYDGRVYHEHLMPDADYYLFNDSGLERCYIYKTLPTPYFDEDPVRSARFVKTHAHILLPQHQIALWADGNVLIRDDISSLIDEFEQSNLPVAAIPHPLRASVYEEAKECILRNKDDAPIIEAQMRRYRSEGFDCCDLVESNFMMFRIEHPELAPFLDTWWSEIERGSRRDQLSFNYAMRKVGGSWFRLTEKPTSVRNHPAFALFHHGSLSSPHTPTVVRSTEPLRTYAEVMAERMARQKHRRADVVVCVHNALDVAKRCLQSVADSRDPTRHRIVIVNDGSDGATGEWLSQFSSREPNTRLIHHEIARGYTCAANAGLRSMKGDLAILLNSDTEVAGPWIDKMLDAALSNPGVGIVGPLSSAASHQSIPDHESTATQTAINDLPPGYTVADVNEWCERNSPSDFIPRVPLVHGFCFGVTHEAVQRIGYFDEQNFSLGYGEENDYCFRAVDAGLTLAIATHTYVFHEKSQSYDDARRQMLVKAGNMRIRELHGAERVLRAVRSMQTHPHLRRLRALAAKLYTADSQKACT